VLNVSGGSLTVSTTVSGGLTAGQVTGNNSGLLTLTAPLTQINATLADPAGLSYTPATGFFGTATLTVPSNHLGNTGSGGQQSDTDSLSITVIQTDLNDAPVNTLPATATTAANTPVSLTGISVTDPDAGTALITVTFTVSSGSLGVNSAVAGGVSLAQV